MPLWSHRSGEGEGRLTGAARKIENLHARCDLRQLEDRIGCLAALPDEFGMPLPPRGNRGGVGPLRTNLLFELLRARRLGCITHGSSSLPADIPIWAAERQRSAAAGSGSDAGAGAGGSRLQRL